jgi:hypothetical protein
MADTAFGTGPADNSSGTGGVDTKHPDWEEHIDEWRQMRITASGPKQVKECGVEYLPMPSGFTTHKDKGVNAYNSYQKRARFPNIVGPTIVGMSGVIHRMEAQVEMPDAMEPLWERATKDGLPLEALHRKITNELLTTGRYALLADAGLAETGGSDIPFIVCYTAEALINWSEDYDFFVLDEEAYKRNGFAWTLDPQWRVLELVEGKYQQRVFSGPNKTEAEAVEPTALGAKPLDVIPFVVMGTMNLSTDVDTPPLMGVSEASLAYYQLSADYRHQLYMSGQETLFVYNMPAPETVGSGVIVSIEDVSKDQHEPKAEYVGPDCKGIEAHKDAMQDELTNAAKAGARLFEQSETQSSQESGESRRMRYAAETSTLTTIARTAAQGLEKALKYIAMMMGLNPDDVVVTPNLSFVDVKMSAEDATKLVDIWMNEAISYETLYGNLQKGEIASAERTFEDEQKLIDAEVEEKQKKFDAANAGMIDPLTGKPVQPRVPGAPAPAPAPKPVPKVPVNA